MYAGNVPGFDYISPHSGEPDVLPHSTANDLTQAVRSLWSKDADLSDKLNSLISTIQAHIQDTNNPHRLGSSLATMLLYQALWTQYRTSVGNVLADGIIPTSGYGVIINDLKTFILALHQNPSTIAELARQGALDDSINVDLASIGMFSPIVPKQGYNQLNPIGRWVAPHATPFFPYYPGLGITGTRMPGLTVSGSWSSTLVYLSTIPLLAGYGRFTITSPYYTTLISFEDSDLLRQYSGDSLAGICLFVGAVNGAIVNLVYKNGSWTLTVRTVLVQTTVLVTSTVQTYTVSGVDVPKVIVSVGPSTVTVFYVVGGVITTKVFNVNPGNIPFTHIGYTMVNRPLDMDVTYVTDLDPSFTGTITSTGTGSIRNNYGLVKELRVLNDVPSLELIGSFLSEQ